MQLHGQAFGGHADRPAIGPVDDRDDVPRVLEERKHRRRVARRRRHREPGRRVDPAARIARRLAADRGGDPLLERTCTVQE